MNKLRLFANNKNYLTNFSSRFASVVFVFLLILAAQTVVFSQITVDRFDDTAAATACTAAANDCSIRGSFAFADAHSGTTINIPAGNYNLSLDELRVGNATNISTTITGAGANLVTINQTLSRKRIINLNPTLDPNVVVNISGIRFTGGNSPLDDLGGGNIQNFGGGAIIGGGWGSFLGTSGFGCS
ncbi:MAG TPA: hypothetical protein PKY59_24150, partial [Pyrinomonadaceae bacterium]|nr:hypothetical protein [Pyrinomonadaceae bacterium]